MIASGYSNMNESYTGELAKAVKNLTSSQKRAIAGGLGDVDIEHSDIPMTKLSSARDPKIKNKDCYFFLVYKAVPSGKLTVAVTDEIRQRMILDTGLTKVENADGETIEVNSKAGSLNWTKRINYAYAIYMLKASDAASAAEIRAKRADSKKGSDQDFNSPNRRVAAKERQWIDKMDPGRYDKSGYRRPTASDWAHKKFQLSTSAVLDINKEIDGYTKLFDQVLDSFSKYLLSYKGKPETYDRWNDKLNDYRNLMIEITDQVKMVTEMQSEMSTYASPDDYFKATKTKYDWDENTTNNIKIHNADYTERITSLRSKFTKI